MQWIRSIFATSGPLSWPVRLVSTALFLAALAMGAYWVMILTTPKPALAPAPVSQGVLGEAGAAQAVHLFGMAQSSSASTGPTASTSTIKVQGIISAGVRGAAIVSIEGKPGRFVAVGSTLAPESPNTKVVQVKPDAVVLEVNGRTEELPAPPKSNIQILTSGVGKPRMPTDLSAPPAAPPGAFPNQPPPAVQPPAPPAMTPPVAPPAPGQEAAPSAPPPLLPRVSRPLGLA